MAAHNRRVATFIGRILHIDDHIATEDFNPYALALGTTFHIVIAEECGRRCACPLQHIRIRLLVVVYV